MKEIQYKDTELNQLMTRKRKPHSYTKRTTPFPYTVTQTDKKNIVIRIFTEKQKSSNHFK